MWDGAHLRLGALSMPAAVCDDEGVVEQITPLGLTLLATAGTPVSPGDPLPASLWQALVSAPSGDAIEWRPRAELSIGCARHPLGISHSLLLMRDVSERNVQRAQRLHKQRLEGMGRLIATVAHDIRTPLSTIIYNADLLVHEHGMEGDDKRECYEHILFAGQRLRDTVAGLLGYARLGPVSSVDVRVADAFTRVSSLLSTMLRDGGHHLVTSVEPGAEFIRANPLMVDQVLVNLISNAVEAASEPITVHITATRHDDSARVTVQDDGPGIPAHLLEHVFQPFFTTKPSGIGIGLTAARDAARELGGDLTAQPSDRGACFVLTVPAGHEPSPVSSTR